jgi:hypothetical protein
MPVFFLSGFFFRGGIMLRRIGSFTGLFAGLLCLCAAVGGYALNVDEENVPLKLLAGTERMIYKVYQKVPITVYLKNIGENPVEIVEPAIDKRSFFSKLPFPTGRKINCSIFTV